MQTHETYMHRCLTLAALGAGEVAPNPLVGSVLVHEGRIIGEGWHRKYGGPHAEINCLASVQESDLHLVPMSTLYVSLEPCAHFGKTPPCVQRIIQERIPEVVIACRDPFPGVNGKGIGQLKSANIRVTEGVLEREAQFLNRRFFTRQLADRPYIILKWAETVDGMIAGPGGQRLEISNDVTNRLVHRWRSEESAIMVGRGTILADDPVLTNRLWSGAQPVRVVADRQLRLSKDRKVFNGDAPTVVLNEQKDYVEGNIRYLRIPPGSNLDPALKSLSALGIQSILVEGGTTLLHSFMQQGYYDEIRRIVSGSVLAPGGISAPRLEIAGNPQEKVDSGKTSNAYILERVERIGTDRIEYFTRTASIKP